MDRRANKMPPLRIPAEEVNRLGNKVPPYRNDHIRDPIDAVAACYGSYDEYYEDQYRRQIDTSGIADGYPGEDDEWDNWGREKEVTVFRRKSRKPSEEELAVMKAAVSKDKPI